MASNTVLKARLQVKQEALQAANSAYIALLKGNTKSYAIGSKNLTKLDLPQLESTISKLEREVDELESLIAGGRVRKSVGIVPRDI